MDGFFAAFNNPGKFSLLNSKKEEKGLLINDAVKFMSIKRKSFRASILFEGVPSQTTYENKNFFLIPSSNLNIQS